MDITKARKYLFMLNKTAGQEQPGSKPQDQAQNKPQDQAQNKPQAQADRAQDKPRDAQPAQGTAGAGSPQDAPGWAGSAADTLNGMGKGLGMDWGITPAGLHQFAYRGGGALTGGLGLWLLGKLLKLQHPIAMAIPGAAVGWTGGDYLYGQRKSAAELPRLSPGAQKVASRVLKAAKAPGSDPARDPRTVVRLSLRAARDRAQGKGEATDDSTQPRDSLESRPCGKCGRKEASAGSGLSAQLLLCGASRSR